MSATADPADRPLRADARRNRERIVQAARAVFAEYGSLAQIDEIAARAEVGVGTVYRHFPTKDALMGELVKQKFERLRDRAVRLVEAGGDPWESFTQMLRESAEEMEGDRAQERMMWEVTAGAFEVAAPVQRELREAGDVLVRRAVEAGVLREDFTVDHIGPFMCGLGSAMAMGDLPGPGRGGEWRKLLEIFFDGLRAKPGGA